MLASYPASMCDMKPLGHHIKTKTVYFGRICSISASYQNKSMQVNNKLCRNGISQTSEVIMAESKEAKFAEFTKKSADIITCSNDADGHVQQLSDIAADLGLQSYIGWILYAGQVVDGTFQVQFNISGNGYSSRWPEWAYEPARDSLLHEKKVWVISDGVPFARNLLQVLFLNRPA